MRNEIIEYLDGGRESWVNGQLHHEDGPAYERNDGPRAWFQNDQLHRLDGPAYEGADGHREWWINGVEYTEEEYNIEMRLRKWGLKVDA